MQTRGVARQELPEEFAGQLRGLLDVNNVLLNALLAASRDADWSAPALAAALQMNAPAISKRVERARTRGVNTELAQQMTAYPIPAPPKIRAMLDGRQLSPDKIAELKAMQLAASKVNGASKRDDQSRQVSKDFAAALHQLIDIEGYSPYYLAGVLEITHRAITARLERHGFREPCPSVAGTPSGVYFNRRIGDPGVGAPRLTSEQRAELRGIWANALEPTDEVARHAARLHLAERIREHLADGFTLANLSQAMTSRERKVRYSDLQQVLAEQGGKLAGSIT
jgi:hypothetical protein